MLFLLASCQKSPIEGYIAIYVLGRVTFKLFTHRPSKTQTPRYLGLSLLAHACLGYCKNALQYYKNRRRSRTHTLRVAASVRLTLGLAAISAAVYRPSSVQDQVLGAAQIVLHSGHQRSICVSDRLQQSVC